MKKFTIFISLLICFAVNCFGLDMHSMVKENNSNYFIAISTKNRDFTCGLAYRSDSDMPEFGFEGSGITTYGKNYFENDKNVIIRFCYVFVGHEFSERSEQRTLILYEIKLDKNYLVKLFDENKNFNTIQLTIDYNPVIIALADDKGSVESCTDFFTKFETDMRISPSIDALKMRSISTSDKFEILNIVCSKKTKNEIWIKIIFEEDIGYIPLSALSHNWTVIENNFPKQKGDKKFGLF